MCIYMEKNNTFKLIFLDIKGGKTTIQTRRKSRVTNGFNIYKVDLEAGILYILNLKNTIDKEQYRVFKISVPVEELTTIKTDLKGYSENIVEKYKDEIWSNPPIIVADNLEIALLSFSRLPGDCDVVLKIIKDIGKSISIKFLPLVNVKLDSKTGKEYYFETGGDYREVLEMAVKNGEIIELKDSDRTLAIKSKKI